MYAAPIYNVNTGHPFEDIPRFAVWDDVLGGDGTPRCGDHIEYRTLPDGRLVFAVVSVEGHGRKRRVTAYFVATNLITLLTLDCRIERAMLLAESDLRAEYRDEPARVARVFAGTIDPYRGHLRYVSAGHDTALVNRGRSGFGMIESTCAALGTAAGSRCAASTLALNPGDDLVVVSEGVWQSRDALGAPFGAARTAHSVRRAIASGADPARCVLSDAAIFSSGAPDDRAAFVVTYTAPL